MPSPIAIVGCGGHGRELGDIIEAINSYEGHTWTLIGFLDDAPQARNTELIKTRGSKVLGPTAMLKTLAPDIHYVIGVGDPRIRTRLATECEASNRPAATLVHPTATIGSDSKIGSGSVLFAGARITTNVTLGRHVHLNQNSTVGHDSTLADYVSVNPLAAVSGDCRVEASVLVGTSAAVLQGLRIGQRSIVGAGACVVRDVPDGVTVKGIPAR